MSIFSLRLAAMSYAGRSTSPSYSPCTPPSPSYSPCPPPFVPKYYFSAMSSLDSVKPPPAKRALRNRSIYDSDDSDLYQTARDYIQDTAGSFGKRMIVSEASAQQPSKPFYVDTLLPPIQRDNTVQPSTQSKKASYPKQKTIHHGNIVNNNNARITFQVAGRDQTVNTNDSGSQAVNRSDNYRSSTLPSTADSVSTTLDIPGIFGAFAMFLEQHDVAPFMDVENAGRQLLDIMRKAGRLETGQFNLG